MWVLNTKAAAKVPELSRLAAAHSQKKKGKEKGKIIYIELIHRKERLYKKQKQLLHMI